MQKIVDALMQSKLQKKKKQKNKQTEQFCID